MCFQFFFDFKEIMSCKKMKQFQGRIFFYGNKIVIKARREMEIKTNLFIYMITYVYQMIWIWISYTLIRYWVNWWRQKKFVHIWACIHSFICFIWLKLQLRRRRIIFFLLFYVEVQKNRKWFIFWFVLFEFNERKELND